MNTLARMWGAILCLMVIVSGAPAQMSTERVAFGLDDPTFVTAPEGDTERLFILEQRGTIRILKNGTLLSTPFLDWTSSVQSNGNEQGLLGLAFDPGYDTNGFFYIYYTAGTFGRSEIRRFNVSANPDSADENSAFRIFRFNQTDTNHNGGHIEFGPDGFLYIGLGDGGGANDPNGAGQNGQTLLGKMLRIDLTGDDFPADANQNYAIPQDNPFVGNGGFRDEIWAYGMRNPYRWSFDELTGDLYIADVGQSCWEEIDFQPASSTGGENYGWSINEGNHCFTSQFVCNNPPCGFGLTFPILEYSHSGGACSITGGRVYRGGAIPSMQGHYFYADFCTDQIFTFRYDGVSVQDQRNRTSELDPPGSPSIAQITAFGKDGLGELYIAERNGEIFKIIPDPTSVGVDPTVENATGFQLAGGTPNPFRGSTQLELTLAHEAHVAVSVYTAAGRLVRELHQGPAPAGLLPVVWNGRDSFDRPLAAGVYFIRAESRGRIATESVTLVR